ncbi:18S rRNA (guanine1575-N7)-methyltransferase [Nematocida homosporus]|uniref:18S rRNA (guanine1575-N7)-methyltransferase n=1 Tax=Nematocida homosporus TaxID=1912981 RepID=UPI00221FBD1A|nr:18S rRNA (guanine1575-N7)-methyltransferase [Nematocida homosporus]KAI5187463.1 18S rRNA (guanine1575-N7)-methyltransferase [Nematocida homosporus]
MGRPENSGAKVYYTGEVAQKYDASSSLNNIQGRITERCLAILNDPEDSMVLDIGCGSGISTEKILDSGNFVIGVDISREMLELARERVKSIFYDEDSAEKYSDWIEVDIGTGLPFRSAVFDYAVSVSVLQWLVVQKDYKKLLSAFFYTLYDALKSDGIAVLQYYPETDKHMDDIMKYALKFGFAGGTLVENQDSKKKRKTYLILEMPGAKGKSKHLPSRKEKTKTRVTNRNLSRQEWVLKKKAKRESKGHYVPETSKYSGRKRSGRLG